MKTLRALEAFVQATGKPVLLQIDKNGRRSAQTLAVLPQTEFTGDSFEQCCQRMADYVEQRGFANWRPTDA